MSNWFPTYGDPFAGFLSVEFLEEVYYSILLLVRRIAWDPCSLPRINHRLGLLLHVTVGKSNSHPLVLQNCLILSLGLSAKYQWATLLHSFCVLMFLILYWDMSSNFPSIKWQESSLVWIIVNMSKTPWARGPMIHVPLVFLCARDAYVHMAFLDCCWCVASNQNWIIMKLIWLSVWDI